MADISFKCPKGVLTLRDNHWDTAAIGKKVMEITDWNIEDNLKREFMQEFSQFLSQSDVELCLVRLPLQERKLVHYFQSEGAFLFSEVSLSVSIDNIGRDLRVSEKFLGHTTIRMMQKEDYDAIEQMATSIFRHGRFAEDIQIPVSAHKQRQKNWVRDIVNGPEEILVNETSRGVQSFMAYERKSDDHIELILGGSAEGNAFAGVMFWHEVMNYFAKSGVKKISTIVSAANISVIRLYESLGFKVQSSYAGLHWHR